MHDIAIEENPIKTIDSNRRIEDRFFVFFCSKISISLNKKCRVCIGICIRDFKIRYRPYIIEKYK